MNWYARAMYASALTRCCAFMSFLKGTLIERQKVRVKIETGWILRQKKMVRILCPRNINPLNINITFF
jgi:hypothetical protein